MLLIDGVGQHASLQCQCQCQHLAALCCCFHGGEVSAKQLARKWSDNAGTQLYTYVSISGTSISPLLVAVVKPTVLSNESSDKLRCCCDM